MRRAELADLRFNGLHLQHRVGHQRLHVHLGVADAVDKRGVGTILQQAPHQIGQQCLMRSHRGVYATGATEFAIGHKARDLFVERLAHAVQALEFVLTGIVILARQLVNRGYGLRVVRGKLRIDRIGHRQQFARTGKIGNIGINLARIDRVAIQAVHLGALDFRVPVGALDQADHQPVTAAPCQIDHMVNHVRATLEVGLHDKADAVPAFER